MCARLVNGASAPKLQSATHGIGTFTPREATHNPASPASRQSLALTWLETRTAVGAPYMRYLVIPAAAIPVAFLLTGCVAEVAPPRVEVVARPPVVYVPAPPRAVVSVYVEPPISEPEPIAV